MIAAQPGSSRMKHGRDRASADDRAVSSSLAALARDRALERRLDPETMLAHLVQAPPGEPLTYLGPLAPAAA
jgi:hypothetical protein